MIIEDRNRIKYIEGLTEYRKSGDTGILQALFLEEQKKYKDRVDYFLGVAD